MSFRGVVFLCLIISLAGCNSVDGNGATVNQTAASTASYLALQRGYGPGGQFYGPPPKAAGQSLATNWPIVLVHSWSNTARESFLGDDQRPFGIKKMLEAGGAIVYQPDTLPYAASEVRGQLLYKKCAGNTLDDVFCHGSNPKPVDGIHAAILDYCSDFQNRARHGFASQAQCHRKLQFNIICHSQGCLGSRYMMAAVTNEFSGKLMYHNVASWTSLAGANKGTALADWILNTLAACLFPNCRSLALDVLLGVDGLGKGEILNLAASKSVVALSRKYILQTTDMNCTPGRDEDCAPSFNALYPLPEDPQHPILYQTFSSKINDITHPCFRKIRLFWEIVQPRQGASDGYIAVTSQRFTTYGAGSSGGETPVIPRWVMGKSLDPNQPFPGLPHMAYSSAEVPGMDKGRLSCAGEDNSAFRFSREDFFRNFVAELVRWGY